MSVAAVTGISGIIIALIAAAGTVYTQRSIRSAAQRTKTLEVEAAAYGRARERDVEVIASFRDEITELKARVAELARRDHLRDQQAHKHVAWDNAMRNIVYSLDPSREIPPAPPLFID